jgi:hypothetical protein
MRFLLNFCKIFFKFKLSLLRNHHNIIYLYKIFNAKHHILLTLRDKNNSITLTPKGPRVFWCKITQNYAF